MEMKRKRGLRLVRRAAILAAIACIAAVPAAAQGGGQITSWGLVQVIAGETGSNMLGDYPTEVNVVSANSMGGELIYTTRLARNESCYIRSRITWVFNRDVSRVTQGDIIEVTLYNQLEGSNFCTDLGGNQVPRVEAHGSNSGSAGGTELLPEGLDPDAKYWSEGDSGRIYGIEQPASVAALRIVGVGKAEILVRDQTPIGSEQDSQHGFFTIEISGALLYDIVYLFDAGQGGSPLPPAFNSPPTEPTLVYPANAWCPALDPNDIVFQWQNNGDRDGDAVVFQLEILQYDEYAGEWSQVYISDDMSATSFAMQGFAVDAYYAWHVYAIDRAGRSDPYYSSSGWSYFSTAIDDCSW